MFARKAEPILDLAVAQFCNSLRDFTFRSNATRETKSAASLQARRVAANASA